MVVLGMTTSTTTSTTTTTTNRTWHDIDTLHGTTSLDPFDDELIDLVTEIDPLNEIIVTISATVTITNSPTTNLPSLSPSFVPTTTAPTTLGPTIQPSTNFPTTIQPTTVVPTQNPTSSPTLQPTDLYPFNEPPLFPEPWYFNYDTRPNALYGPGYYGLIETTSSSSGSSGSSTSTELMPGFKNNQWGVTWEAPPAEFFYWNEFTDQGFGPWKNVLDNHIPSRNRCNRVGLQSPIDVKHNGLGKCHEFHEVRSLAGDFRLSGDKVHKEILSNKLRFRYDRRPCSNLNKVECQEPDPPHADFPLGWGGFADALHVDFKIPSEHWMNGKQYHGEMQVYHIHSTRRRLPTISTLIEAQENGFNWYFDEALQAFDYEFRRNEIICEASKRKERRNLSLFHKTMKRVNNYLRGGRTTSTTTTASMDTDIDNQEDNINNNNNNITDSDYLDTWGQYSIHSDAPNYHQELYEQQQRILQNGVWDPNHPMVVPSIHFYRYEGSLTEPPCSEFVSWFITDKPMIISFDQLEQMKKILFNHVDATCHRTSVHYQESVARPIQDTANRPVYLCTEVDFGPDP